VNSRGMEAPSAVDAGQARTFPSPVKHSTTANNRSVSTRAPSESGTLASVASYLTQRVQQHEDSGHVSSDPLSEDDLFNDEFEPEADELLEDCGAEDLVSEQSCQSGQMGFLAQSRSERGNLEWGLRALGPHQSISLPDVNGLELTSPVFSDRDDDGRGGFNLCQTQALAIDFDEESTTAGSVSPTFRNFLDGDDEEIGMCMPMLGRPASRPSAAIWEVPLRSTMCRALSTPAKFWILRRRMLTSAFPLRRLSLQRLTRHASTTSTAVS